MQDAAPTAGPDVEAVLVYMTTPSEDVAAGLVRLAVAERLAACGSVLPAIRSIYRWKGEVCDDPEVLVILKTTRAGFGALRDRLVAEHPYDCPEVVATPVVAGHGPYLDWVNENVG